MTQRSPVLWTLGTIALLATAVPLRGQSDGVGIVAGPYRVKWDVGNLLVSPDTVLGVGFWFETNSHAQVAGHETHSRFEERFKPEEFTDWLIMTRQLLELTEPMSWDTSAVLTSGSLRGMHGGLLVVGRVRNGKKLANSVRVLMYPSREKPILLELQASGVDTLLKVAQTAAALSAYRPIAAMSARWGGGPIVPVVGVGATKSNYHPRYPEALQQRGIEGEVWARFMVNPDGRPDVDTFEALLSDDRDFEVAVREYLGHVKYVAATVDGTPVRAVAVQRFVFGFNRP